MIASIERKYLLMDQVVHIKQKAIPNIWLVGEDSELFKPNVQ